MSYMPPDKATYFWCGFFSLLSMLILQAMAECNYNPGIGIASALAFSASAPTAVFLARSLWQGNVAPGRVLLYCLGTGVLIVGSYCSGMAWAFSLMCP